MKKNLKLIYIVELALFFLILILCSTLNVMANNYRNYLAITFLFLLILPSYFIFGFSKDNNYNKDNGLRTIIIVTMIFGIVSYLLGLFIGFNKGFSIDFNTIFNGIIPIILLTISVELLRFIVLKKAFYNKKTIILFTIFTSIIYILLNVSLIDSSYKMFLFFSTIIVPYIAIEALCAYLSVNIGFLPCVVLKFILFLYPYILPIVPNYGDYLKSVIDILLCFSIFFSINKNLLVFDKSKKRINKFIFNAFTIPLLIVLVILIILISGIFKYQLIAIASNSMIPSYYRGDALMIEKCNIKDIKIGDVLVFKSEGRVITHRVIKKYMEHDQLKFITKGDNNKTRDGIISDKSNYLGKGIFIVKYIGYPTVWLNEKFKEG